MLDSFEIFSTTGVVLWSKSYASVGPHIINSLISDVFIEERIQAKDTSKGLPNGFKKDKYTLKWRRSKDLELIFVAVYQSLLHLTWVDKLLDNISTIFVDLYKDRLKSEHARVLDYPFDKYFEQQVRELESESGPSIEIAPVSEEKRKDVLVESDNGGPPPPLIPGLVSAQQYAAQTVPSGDKGSASSASKLPPNSSSAGVITGRASPHARLSRRARKTANMRANANVSSGYESTKKGKNNTAKKGRKWGPDGLVDEDDEEGLDYSAPAEPEVSPAVEAVNQESMGTKTKKGQFVLRDLGDEVHSILDNANSKAESPGAPSGLIGTTLGSISGMFRNIVGGKVLTKADLEKPLKTMEDHLIHKNVAREAAIRLCEGVEKELINQKTGSFQSIESALAAAMESSLRKILTPTSSLDLLREIEAVTAPSSKGVQPRPYVISIVGVNGVGKSTNLSKIAFFLLRNNYRLLIAACDTFRSGAVEQLRVHARNLSELSARENLGHVELYEKGYGKDAANVAKDAVSYAASKKYDVVLIDTAGRRHNDQRLMSSLEKFAKFANPDKIFMVGEALVGTDSVMQARNFNAAFGHDRGLDGFIISKCDTVGGMVGTLVSMVHATGIPVVFLGIGQHYGDIRGLSVPWAVNLLMK